MGLNYIVVWLELVWVGVGIVLLLLLWVFVVFILCMDWILVVFLGWVCVEKFRWEKC